MPTPEQPADKIRRAFSPIIMAGKFFATTLFGCPVLCRSHAGAGSTGGRAGVTVEDNILLPLWVRQFGVGVSVHREANGSHAIGKFHCNCFLL
jgi:hypothetical protein